MSAAGGDGFHGALPLAVLLVMFATENVSLTGILDAATQPGVAFLILAILAGMYR